jgi:hypothetical protein
MIESPLSNIDLAVVVVTATGGGMMFGSIDPNWIVVSIVGATSLAGLIWFFVRNLLLASSRRADQDQRIALLEQVIRDKMKQRIIIGDALRNEFDDHIEENKESNKNLRDRIIDIYQSLGKITERTVVLESKKPQTKDK